MFSRCSHPQKILKRWYFLPFFFLVSLHVLPSSVDSPGYNRIRKRSQPMLSELLKHPDVAPRYEQCKQHAPLDMGECLWEGWKKDGRQVVPPLSSDKKEKIQKLFEGRERFDSNIVSVSDNPALRKLEEYYAKRLRKIIDPEGDKKVVSDHTIYNKIYRSQLGKNVISALSSYCLDARDEDYLLETDPTKTRQTNLKKLETTRTTEDSNTNMAYSHWSGCAFNVQHICYNTCPEKGEGKTNKYCCEEDCENDIRFKQSQNRACEVVDYIKSIRQNLLVLGKIDKQWEEKKSEGIPGFGGEKHLKNVTQKVEIEDITNLSSREVVETSGYGKEQDKIVAEMEECLKSFDPEKCDKFVGIKKDEDRALLDEQSFRTRVLQEKIDMMKSSDKKKDSLEQYLKDEGYSKEEITKILEEKDEKVLSEEISRKFREKRLALQRSLTERFEKTSIDAERPQDRSEILKKLRNEAVNERQRLGELVFFTNMISGFLKIGDGEGNILGQNSESLHEELKDSIFSSEETAKKSLVDFEAIQEAGKKAAPPSDSNQDSQEERNLEVKTINELLLNYD